MSGSSLPVWMAIYLCGMLLVVLMSALNPYVPKDQKKRAKEGKSRVIFYRTRVSESLILFVSAIIIVATTVAFAINGFADLAAFFGGGGLLGIILAVLLTIIGFFLFEMILILIIIIVEDVMIEDSKDYYLKRFGVTLVDLDSYCKSIFKSRNPRD